jgi:hypothetical protein
MKSNVLKNAIESADDNLIQAGADFTVGVIQRKLLPGFGGRIASPSGEEARCLGAQQE